MDAHRYLKRATRARELHEVAREFVQFQREELDDLWKQHLLDELDNDPWYDNGALSSLFPEMDSYMAYYDEPIEEGPWDRDYDYYGPDHDLWESYGLDPLESLDDFEMTGGRP